MWVLRLVLDINKNKIIEQILLLQKIQKIKPYKIIKWLKNKLYSLQLLNI